MKRRKFLQASSSATLLAAGGSLLSACTQSLGQQPLLGRTALAGDRFALVVPQSGEFAALGQDMANAIALGMPDSEQSANFLTLDAGDSDATAEKAVLKALEGGASMIFGPLRSSQTLAALKAAGRVPVVTFSNDESLSGEGAYVLGLTAGQSVLTMFTYAKAQGMSRLAVLAAPTPFGESSSVAASRVADAGGLELTAALLREPGSSGIIDELRSASDGRLPDAVYVPDAGERLYSFARALSGSGIKLLGSAQWAAGGLIGQPELVGASYAAPSPSVFNPFAAEYEASFGETPGIVAALAFDAVLIGQGMIAAGELSARGLQREAGFSGVLGPFRFDRNRRCFRDLAVLSVGRSAIDTVAEVARV